MLTTAAQFSGAGPERSRSGLASSSEWLPSEALVPDVAPGMGRLEFGKLSAAWRGEAADFTPLLSQQLDIVGEAIGVDLVSIGKAEVITDGGRRIDIVAEAEDGAEIVVENQ